MCTVQNRQFSLQLDQHHSANITSNREKQSLELPPGVVPAHNCQEAAKKSRSRLALKRTEALHVGGARLCCWGTQQAMQHGVQLLILVLKMRTGWYS